MNTSQILETGGAKPFGCYGPSQWGKVGLWAGTIQRRLALPPSPLHTRIGPWGYIAHLARCGGIGCLVQHAGPGASHRFGNLVMGERYHSSPDAIFLDPWGALWAG